MEEQREPRAQLAPLPPTFWRGRGVVYPQTPHPFPTLFSEENKGIIGKNDVSMGFGHSGPSWLIPALKLGSSIKGMVMRLGSIVKTKFVLLYGRIMHMLNLGPGAYSLRY